MPTISWEEKLRLVGLPENTPLNAENCRRVNALLEKQGATKEVSMPENDVVRAVTDGLANINKAVVAVDQRVDRLEKDLKRNGDWVSRVEAKANSERNLIGSGDHSVVPAIPEQFRHHLDKADRLGIKDGARKTAFGLWMSFGWHAQVGVQKRVPHSQEQYLRWMLDIERGLGFDRYDVTLKAALGEDTASIGGNLVPSPVESDLLRMISDNSIVRPLATKIAMSAKTHFLPIESTGLTVAIVAEGATIPDSLPASPFSQTPLTAKKFCGLATVSNELFQDEVVNLADYLFTAMAEQIGRNEDSQALDGDGTNYTGLSNAANVSSVSVTTIGNAPTYTDLVKLVFTASEAASRARAVFIGHPKAWQNVVGLIDGQGMPIFQYSNVPNASPDRLLGYPVALSSAINTNRTVGSTGSTTNVYFGPPQKIVFGDVAGMSIDTDPFGLFTTYQTRVRVIKRTAIVVPVGKYFAYLKGVKVG